MTYIALDCDTEMKAATESSGSEIVIGRGYPFTTTAEREIVRVVKKIVRDVKQGMTPPQSARSAVLSRRSSVVSSRG